MAVVLSEVSRVDCKARDAVIRRNDLDSLRTNGSVVSLSAGCRRLHSVCVVLFNDDGMV